MTSGRFLRSPSRLAGRLSVAGRAAALFALGMAVLAEAGPASAGTVTTSGVYGYGVIIGTHTSSAASWTMPTVHCGSAASYEAMWTGLDGYSSTTVEQVGTDADCSGGTADYYGWYELYPSAPVYFSNAVSPGDKMSASVTFSGTSSFTFTLKDATRGWSQTATKALSGAARSSAETVLELPSSYTCAAPATLVTFTGVTADGKPLASLSPAKWQGSNPSIVVGPLTGTTSAGSTFSVSCT